MLKGSERKVSLKRKQGPLYQQIQKILKDRILHGVYPLGSIIPSEPQLEKEFGVSKMTVRGAVQELAQEGYVQKKSGVGTIVMRNTAYQKLSKGKRFTELLVEAGHKLEKKLLSTSLVTNETGTEEYSRYGPYCQRIERLYILDGQPYIHLVHFLTAAALPGGGSAELGRTSSPCTTRWRRTTSCWRTSGTGFCRVSTTRGMPAAEASAGDACAEAPAQLL